MAHTYEVEIKTLLGSKENAENLKYNLHKKFPDLVLISQGRQLNHYFHTPADFKILVTNLSKFIDDKKLKDLENILQSGKKISLRTRDADGVVSFVLKASVGDDTSSNGVKRIEFEARISMKLDELDAILIESGCTYQAKWSRIRDEFANKDMHVCIDKNAGYGYLAEFEKVTTDSSKLDVIRQELVGTMKELGLEELAQDRLERMFAHYNAHWDEYYGTEKTFVIN